MVSYFIISQVLSKRIPQITAIIYLAIDTHFNIVVAYKELVGS